MNTKVYKAELFSGEAYAGIYLASKACLSGVVECRDLLNGILKVAFSASARALRIAGVRESRTRMNTTQVNGSDIFSKEVILTFEEARNMCSDGDTLLRPIDTADLTVALLSKGSLRKLAITPNQFARLVSEIMENDKYPLNLIVPFLDCPSSILDEEIPMETISEEVGMFSQHLRTLDRASIDSIFSGNRLKCIYSELRRDSGEFLKLWGSTIGGLSLEPIELTNKLDILARFRNLSEILFHLHDPSLVDVPIRLKELVSQLQANSLLAYDLIRYTEVHNGEHFSFAKFLASERA